MSSGGLFWIGDIFALTIGNSHEEVSIFSSEAEAWKPPKWILMLTSMSLLSLSVLAIPTFLKSSVEAILAFEDRDNPAFVEASKRIDQLDDAIVEADARLLSAERLLAQLNAEANAYEEKCRAEYRLQQSERRARLAQADLD